MITGRPIIFTAMQMEAAAVGAELGAELVGIGARRLASLAGRDGSHVIMAGLGGALDPKLKVGDVVVDTQVAGAMGLPGIFYGSIHTVDRVICTVQEKTKLFRQTGALAADMENAILRSAAQVAGVPFIGIRAVSDTADQALDPEILSLIDDVGRPRRLSVAALLLRRPGLMGSLMQLDQQSKQAAAALGAAVRRIIETIA
jgi:adenosylhomocysteine nucleosidase